MPHPLPIPLGDKRISFGQHTYIMGTLNVTPDSFSDGGRFSSPQQAVAAGLELWQQGADILDVGGESTRPGAKPVPESEEIERVVPVIAALREQGVDAISIDTRKARVAQEAIAAGAGMVNDVAAGYFDPEIRDVVAAAGVSYVVMHSRDTPEKMQLGEITYRDVQAEVRQWLAEAIEAAVLRGVRRQDIVVDPGIGFGKTVHHNLALTRGLGNLRQLGHAVLYGPSRKSFLGHIIGGAAVDQRLEATLAAVTLAASYGADVVRVHDVAAVRKAVLVADALCREQESGAQLSG